MKLFWANPEQPLVRSISSKDGGLTWGEYKDEFWTPTGSQLWSVASLRARDGSIHMFPLVQRGPLGALGISYFLDVWHTKTKSSDFGARWGHQRLIHQGYVGAIINAIQLPSGRMVLPFAQWIGGKAAGPPTGPNVVISIVSDDGGTTWSPSTTELTVPVESNPAHDQYGAVEPASTILPDGRIWMLIRTQTGYLYKIVFRRRVALDGTSANTVRILKFSGCRVDACGWSHPSCLEQLRNSRSCRRQGSIWWSRRTARCNIGGWWTNVERLQRDLFGSAAIHCHSEHGSRNVLSQRHRDHCW